MAYTCFVLAPFSVEHEKAERDAFTGAIAQRPVGLRRRISAVSLLVRCAPPIAPCMPSPSTYWAVHWPTHCTSPWLL